MPQRAIWRTPPDDPSHPLGWLMRDESLRFLPLPLASILVAALPPAAVLWSPWVLLALPAIAMHVKVPPLPSVAGSKLATVPPPGPAFECDVFIARGDLLYGTDQGIVTFVEGWLYFAGRRTEFALQEAPGLDFMTLGDRVTLLLDGEQVEFWPRGGWDASGKFDEAEAFRFRKAFGVWFHSPSSRDGESLLPPSEIHASGLARAWRHVLSCLSLDALLGALMLTLLGTGIIAFFIVGTGLGSIGRLRRVLRLARKQKKALPNVSKPSIGR